MSTELNELSNFITRLITIYMDIARDGGDLVDAVADLLAPMEYVVVGSEYYIDLVQAAKQEAGPIPERSALFSTFITGEEILDWNIGNQRIRSALVDEAYGRWLEVDKEHAQHYAGCWTGFVEVQPGGFSVRIETEPDDTLPLDTMMRANIHPVSLARCRELVTDLASIQQEVSALGVDEWPVIAHLDEQRSTAMNDLADEMLALLASNNLIGGDNG